MGVIFDPNERAPAGAASGGEGRRRFVAEVMSSPAVAVEASAPARIAFELAAERPVQHLLVTSRGALSGVICVCELWDAAPAWRVGELARSPPVTVSGRATLLQAAARMAEHGLGCLPVLEGDRFGVITLGDLIRAGIDGDFYQRCVYCGSHHHVRSRDGSEALFCLDCLEASAHFDFEDVYVDLGSGD